MIVDLHCHSQFSDGQLSPSILIERAQLQGINLLALTDHDTVAGLVALHAAPRPSSLSIINGIELSTSWKKYIIHVLGLNIDPFNSALNLFIERQNQNRIQRGQQIGIQLGQCGIKDAYNKACMIAGHERVGRPHFAQLLIQEGYVADMKTAFKRYLSRGCPGYAPSVWADLTETVLQIRQANGLAVIAHPLKYKLTRAKLFELIIQFKVAGGVGIEVISGAMTMTQIAAVAAICQRFDLYASSGSDFHGDTVSRVALGRQATLPSTVKPIWEHWI